MTGFLVFLGILTFVIIMVFIAFIFSEAHDFGTALMQLLLAVVTTVAMCSWSIGIAHSYWQQDLVNSGHGTYVEKISKEGYHTFVFELYDMGVNKIPAKPEEKTNTTVVEGENK